MNRQIKYKVSAIVSTYNSELFIRECLEDLEAQTISEMLEIIVVDSCSQQNERAVVEEYQERYDNIVYIRSKKRETLYAAWNRGIKISSGKYITNANTDDRHRRDALEVLANVLDSHPEIGLAYGDCLITENHNETFAKNTAKNCYIFPEFSIRQMLVRQFFGPQPMWRKSVHKEIGYFNTNHVVCGDYDFFIRLGWKFGAVHIPEFLGLYCRRPDSVERANRSRGSREQYEILVKYRNTIPVDEIYSDLINYPDAFAYSAAFADIGNMYIQSAIDVESAIIAYKKGLEHKSDSVELLNNLAVAYLLQGNMTKGRSILNAIKDSPEYYKHGQYVDNNLSSARKNSKDYILAKIAHPVLEKLLDVTAGSLEFSIHDGTETQRQQKLYKQKIAFEKFNAAFEEFHNRKFTNAHKLIKKYKELVNYNLLFRIDNRKNDWPEVSVIVVSFDKNRELLDCVNSIGKQSFSNIEIILVDNGRNKEVVNKIRTKNILYVKTPFNLYPAEARNIGAYFARSPIIAFLDDDGIVPENYAESIIRAYEKYEIIGLRGKILPKTKKTRLRESSHYDLGDVPLRAVIDTEGNSAFRRDIYLQMGGMDPLLFGHEGADICYRIYQEYKQISTVYWPQTLIYHDFAEDSSRLHKKLERHDLMQEYLVFKHPDVYQWIAYYNQFGGEPYLKEIDQQRVTTRINGNEVNCMGLLEKKNSVITYFSKTPQISICIPTYNRGNSIIDAINSATNQAGESIELVVVDDGSTDNTENLVNSFNDSRIRYIRKEHSGAPQARNRAIEEARGENILWLDSDDILLPGVVEAYQKAIQMYPEVGIFYGNLIVTDYEIKPIKQINYPDWHLKNKILKENLVSGNQLPNPGTLVRKSSYDLIGKYDESFSRAHDYEWFTRAVNHLEFKHVGRHVCYWRWHDSNMSAETTNFDTSFEARVIVNMLKRSPLKDIFISVAWDKKPENEIISNLYRFISKNMLRLNQPRIAEQFLKLASEYHKTPEIKQANNDLEAVLNNAAKSSCGGKGINRPKNHKKLQLLSKANLKITAIICAYNEGDVIYHVIGDLIKQGVQVYLIDHHSVDNTVSEASKWLGKGLIKIETFPEDSGYNVADNIYSWRFILRRKENIVKQLGHGWYIHADADEFREAPWSEMLLRQGIERVDQEGYNAIDFRIFGFKPIDNSFRIGADVRNFLKYYSCPQLEIDRLQVKCWKYFGQNFNLWCHGGHAVEFEGRKIYPIRFILRHYPIRSQTHGLQKVFSDRKNRFDPEELKAQWHQQYEHIGSEDHNFLHDKSTLTLYNRDQVCAELLATSGDGVHGLTSIIILTHNVLELTKKCVNSIIHHTAGPYEIIFVDNGSSDRTCDYLTDLVRSHQNFLFIANSENKGFAIGNNQGMRIARGQYVVLMNSDVVVTPGWLDCLIKLADSNSKIGIVGPMTNYASGAQVVNEINYNTTTLEGLSTFSLIFSKKNSGRAVKISKAVGFCMLIKKEVIKKIGGLDSRFGIGNFEDDDYNVRAALGGFETWAAQDCFVHHFGSRTFAASSIDYRETLLKNWNIFKNKWGLPPNLEYGAVYNLSHLYKSGFNSENHFIPLDDRFQSPAQKPIRLFEKLDPYAAVENDNAGHYFQESYDFNHEISKSNTKTLTSHNFINPDIKDKFGGKNMKSMEQMYQEIQPLIDNGWYDVALKALEKLLEAHPQFAIAHNDLGVLYYNQGLKDKALQHYEKAVEFQTENITFRKNLADFYYVELGRVEDALNIYIKILETNPKDVEILLITGHICVAQKNFEEAKDFYQRVLEIEPWNVDARQNLDRLPKNFPEADASQSVEEIYEAAQKAATESRNQEAIQKLKIVLEASSEHAQAHNDLGVLLYREDNKDLAFGHYQKAVQLDPANATFQKNLADFYCIELGQFEKAMQIYVKILENHPQDVETLIAVGYICENLNKINDARDFYRQVLEIEPWNFDARQKLDALNTTKVAI